MQEERSATVLPQGLHEHIVRPNLVAAMDDAEITVDDDVEAGSRSPVKVAAPTQPTDKEIQEHELTHLPFRSWCKECVQGRGMQAPHFRAKKDDHQIKEFHMDFMFLGPKEVAGQTLACMVVREAETRMTLAAAVPYKTTGTYISERIVAFLHETGCLHGDIIVRSDQEPAVMSIIEEVGKIRAQRGGGRFVVENSPVGSSQSNGVAEKAIQSVQGQVRVLKLALEKRWGIKIPHRHSVIPWVVEYAAFLLNRYEVGHDGKTAYERLKGKRAKTLGIEFGEGVHWRMKQAKGALGKLDSLWSDGVYLGIKGKTGEIIIGDAEGVWRTRTIRRKPDAERWRDTHTHASMVVGVPWNHGKHDLEPDGEALPAVTLEPREIEDAKMQDNGIGESHTETRKKRKITFKERPTQEDEDDLGGGTRAQSSGELGARGTEEQCQMEVVLPRIRISGKRSQEHQEDEQQPKKVKNEDDEMDIGKIEEEEVDDGCQPYEKQPLEEEEVFDSKSGEILEQELVQMARKEELDFMEKFGVYEDATIEECFAETGRAPVGTKWVDVNKGTAENPNIRCRLVARDFKPKGEKDRADLFLIKAALGGQEGSLLHRRDSRKGVPRGQMAATEADVHRRQEGSSERQVGCR